MREGVLYEESVFRGPFALPVDDRDEDSLLGLFCAILKFGFDLKVLISEIWIM